MSREEAPGTWTPTRAKILSRSDFAARIRAEAERGTRLVFTNGCFDLVHAGHVRYLDEARRLGDMLAVAVNSDASVRQLKGPARPILALADRMELIAALGCVDLVTSFEEASVLSLIEECRPPILVKGGDRAGDIVGEPFVRGYGGEVRALTLVPGISTTEIVRRIRALPADDSGG